MPQARIYFLGGPCDGQGATITYQDKPPRSVVCRGTTYTLNVNSRGALTYVTAEYQASYNASKQVAGQRDVFRAWHRLMHVLAHRTTGERRRVVHARHRIRRAVR
jgi:hypothetical protein